MPWFKITFYVIVILILLIPLQKLYCYGTVNEQLGDFNIIFSPHEDSLEVIIQLIQSARKTIHVAAYEFTSQEIAIALLEAKKQGVDVRIVADSKHSHQKDSILHILAASNIPIRVNDKYAIFHNKFIVIDYVTVQTGSFNYTKAAIDKNAENLYIIYNQPSAAEIYETQWEQYWEEAESI